MNTSFNATTMLEVFRIGLIVIGAIAALWGIYDIFLGDNGANSSMGTKKLIGGVLFAFIAWLVLTMAISDVEKAESQASGNKATGASYAITETYSDDAVSLENIEVS